MENKAREVLNNYWDGSLPVNPIAIAKKMGIEVHSEENWSYSGYYQYNDGSPIITYNSSEPSTRIRFTVAHEVGHHVNGDVDAPRDSHFQTTQSNYTEVLANRFAAALLMPSHLVEFAIVNKGITSLSGLAELFDVSEVAMQYRLKNLGFLR